MNTLILVNCQNDFITGTMTSKGARTVIENLKNFIKNNYNLIIFNTYENPEYIYTDKKEELNELIFNSYLLNNLLFYYLN